MGFQVYGLIVLATSVGLIMLASSLKQRLAGIPHYGWGKIYLGLVGFALVGILQFLLSMPSFMNSFVPSLNSWLSAFSQIVLALGIILTYWGIANLVNSVRRIQNQETDDAEWRNLYLQLQDLAQQPFSFVEIVNLAVNQLLKRSGADGAAVMLFKENTSELILAALSNLSPETAKRFESLKVTGDIFGRAQKLGRVQNVANLSDSDRGTEELFSGSGFLSAAVFPLRAREKVLGSVGLFSAKPYHFNQSRYAAITIATNHLATLLESVRSEKEITRLKDRMKPSEEAKRITEELFFRRGMGSNLALREVVEFERVRKFFDADCIKLVFRDRDGEYRIKASSGGAETGLLMDRRKLTGINRAVSERKLLLLTSPSSAPAGNGFDSMPRQTLFIPIPYPDRDDLVLLLESETASLEFTEEKLSAVRVASVYLADLHFLFLAKSDGERYRHSLEQVEHFIGRIINSSSRKELVTVLGECCSVFLPNCRARLILLDDSTKDKACFVDSFGLQLPGESDRSRQSLFLKVYCESAIESGEEESLMSRSALAENLPAEWREKFAKVFSRIPDTVLQIVFPIPKRNGDFGTLILLFSADDSVPRESLELCRRLVDLTALVIARTSAFMQKDGVTASRIAETVDHCEAVQASAIPNHDLEASSKVEFPGTESFASGTNTSGVALADILAQHNIDTNIDWTHSTQSNNGELASTISELVHKLFAGQLGNRLYLSSFSDEHFDYYQITSSEEEMRRFRERQLDNYNWTPCPFALDMPSAFRSLAGDYQIRCDSDGAISLIWRMPHIVIQKEKMRRMSILGIDDQEVIRELLGSIITRMGHRIVSTADGKDALRLFKEGRFDLVIAEAGLPGISGWDIAEQVKAISPDTPVIMLSGWGPQPEEKTARGKNADFILTKPFRVDQLGKVIGAACEMISTK